MQWTPIFCNNIIIAIIIHSMKKKGSILRTHFYSDYLLYVFWPYVQFFYSVLVLLVDVLFFQHPESILRRLLSCLLQKLKLKQRLKWFPDTYFSNSEYLNSNQSILRLNIKFYLKYISGKASLHPNDIQTRTIRHRTSFTCGSVTVFPFHCFVLLFR